MMFCGKYLSFLQKTRVYNAESPIKWEKEWLE